MPGLDLSGFFTSLFWLWLVIELWFFGFPAVWLANQKGRDPLIWAIAAVLFGPIALFVLGVAPRGARGRFAPCPACREAVDSDAEVCPFCRVHYRPELREAASPAY